jgi:hypothetical protein
MTLTMDISEVAGGLEALQRIERGAHTIVVVVPIEEGASDVVREFLTEGPPFDPGAIGLSRHEVLLTDREVVFVFEAKECAKALERILAEPEFWDVVSSWERNAAAEPRLGSVLYRWEAPRP